MIKNNEAGKMSHRPFGIDRVFKKHHKNPMCDFILDDEYDENQDSFESSEDEVDGLWVYYKK